ncbi:MAG: methionine--tRNA ligase subunit beta, partial [Planctomycetes bacterium]|nr:methionine--tRNA ligase subunit beta [Planctomycetota bacterium]
VFHCLIFPLMLKLHGDFVLPSDVPANEFLNLEGQKLSTSRNWAVWLDEALDAFPADYLRYALCAIMPETKDSDFAWRDFGNRINNELADTLGNLVHRCVTFGARTFEGVVPELSSPSDVDLEALDLLAHTTHAVAEKIESYKFREALSEAMNLARHGNKYFNDGEPWKTKKSDKERCANTIHVSLQIVASLSVILEPFLPFTCARLRSMLGIGPLRSADVPQGIGWNDAAKPLLQPGSPITEGEPLVPKIEDVAIEEQLTKLEQASRAAMSANDPGQDSLPYSPLAPQITFDDFAKIDLRVGRVVAAEKMKKSKKLLRCDVDLGFETRQILAGVAEHLSPEDLIGKTVLVVANLAPRPMMGTESQGMMLMAEGRLGDLVPTTADQEPGAPVR